MEIFWDAVPCTPGKYYRCFRGYFYFYHQGDECIMSDSCPDDENGKHI
jgi:hypothetical protein